MIALVCNEHLSFEVFDLTAWIRVAVDEFLFTNLLPLQGEIVKEDSVH